MPARLTWRVPAIVLLAAAFSSMASAETGGLVGRQKRFIRDLFSQQRYFDVISETRRLMALDPAGDGRNEYTFFMDVNYFLGRQYRTVVANITSRPGPPDYRAGILLSQSYLRLGMNGRSLEAALRVPYGAVEIPGRYPLLARRAEAYLECGLYRELLEEIGTAGRYIPDGDRVGLLRDEVERFRKIPLKSVPLAVALSVLFPGAGQMYAGKWVHGVVSFIGVASLAGGAYLLYRQGNRKLSSVFMAFTSVFYLGTIYGAYNAAQTANEDLHRTFRDGIRKKCIPAYDPAGEVRDNGIFR